MKKGTTILIAVTMALSLTWSAQAEDINVLILLSHLYGPNVYYAMDDFEQYGWHITTTGVNRTIAGCQGAGPETARPTDPFPRPPRGDGQGLQPVI